jgi:antirestriction protein ArdC
MDRKIDVYQKVTDLMIAELEKGCIPWIRPWRDGEPPIPVNALSGRPYHGINVPLLWNSADRRGFSCDRWLTFRQVETLGGTVHQGEQASFAVLYLPRTREMRDCEGNPVFADDGEPEVHHFGLVRAFRLFNLSQCEGLPASLFEPYPRPDHPVDVAESLLRSSGVSMTHRQQSEAFYRPATDAIMMPHPQQFDSGEAYYATLLHELTHATGHASRLNRKAITDPARSKEAYAAEELVAEMGAAFLCALTGIEGRLQHASYIDFWLQILRNDKRALMRASGLARSACDWLLNASEQDSQLTA